MPGKHLVVRVTPYNKFRLEVVDSETSEVVDSDHFNQLEGIIPAIRVWLMDAVRDAVRDADAAEQLKAESEEQKMAVLRANLDEAFSPLLALQKPASQETLRVIVNMPAGAAETLNKMAGLFPEGHLQLWPLSIRSIEPYDAEQARFEERLQKPVIDRD